MLIIEGAQLRSKRAINSDYHWFRAHLTRGEERRHMKIRDRVFENDLSPAGHKAIGEIFSIIRPYDAATFEENLALAERAGDIANDIAWKNYLAYEKALVIATQRRGRERKMMETSAKTAALSTLQHLGERALARAREERERKDPQAD